MSRRYAVRRFCKPGSRPDCFEVFDTVTDEAVSFGCYRYEAEEAARAMNEHLRATIARAWAEPSR